MAGVMSQISTRSILFVLVVLNFVGIGLSEVQRRALVENAVASQQTVARQILSLKEMQAKLGAAQEQEARFLEWHDSKLDRTAALLSPEANPRSDRLATLADSRTRDAIRADHVKVLKTALGQYYATKGAFPGPFADNPIADLNTQLVGGGYLQTIPTDPLPGKSYRYTTAGAPDGKRYGLEVSLENGGDCLTGVGAGTGWWGTLPQCPF
jgi:hypothetical protein